MSIILGRLNYIFVENIYLDNINGVLESCDFYVSSTVREY